MTVKALFQTWHSLQDMLSDPILHDDETGMLVTQSMQIIRAMAHTPSTGLVDVLLKLEAYGREVAAGPCEECDALLSSALHDRMVILSRLAGSGLAAGARGEHRPRPPQEIEYEDDQHTHRPADRSQDSRSAPS